MTTPRPALRVELARTLAKRFSRRGPATVQACSRCAVTYRPGLTQWRCPLCAAPAELAGTGRRTRAADNSDDRLVAMVVAATIANILLLAILAIAVLHATR